MIRIEWIEKPASVYEINHCVRLVTPDGRDHLLTVSEAISLSKRIEDEVLCMAQVKQSWVLGRVSEKKMRVQCLKVSRSAS